MGLDPDHGHDGIGFKGITGNVAVHAGRHAAQVHRFHGGDDRSPDALLRDAQVMQQHALSFGIGTAVAAHGGHDERREPHAAQGRDAAAYQQGEPVDAPAAHGHGHAGAGRQGPQGWGAHDLCLCQAFDIGTGRCGRGTQPDTGEGGDRDGRDELEAARSESGDAAVHGATSGKRRGQGARAPCPRCGYMYFLERVTVMMLHFLMVSGVSSWPMPGLSGMA